MKFNFFNDFFKGIYNSGGPNLKLGIICSQSEKDVPNQYSDCILFQICSKNLLPPRQKFGAKMFLKIKCFETALEIDS